MQNPAKLKSLQSTAARLPQQLHINSNAESSFDYRGQPSMQRDSQMQGARSTKNHQASLVATPAGHNRVISFKRGTSPQKSKIFQQSMGAQSELSQKNAVDYHFSQYRMLDMASGPTTVLSGFENESMPALNSIHSAGQHQHPAQQKSQHDRPQA